MLRTGGCVRALAVAVGACVLLLVAACSPPGSYPSQADQHSSPATPGTQRLWDPCTLPDRALTAAGAPSQILLRQSVGSDLSGDLCALVLRSATSLNPDLPH